MCVCQVSVSAMNRGRDLARHPQAHRMGSLILVSAGFAHRQYIFLEITFIRKKCTDIFSAPIYVCCLRAVKSRHIDGITVSIIICK